MSKKIICVGLVLIGSIWFWLRQPQTEGVWVQGQARIPKVTRENYRVRIEGVRDFIYENKAKVLQARYLTKSYNISDVRRVWYGLSHFSGKGLAHAFLSFEFSSGEFLVSSIEARIEQGAKYHPLKGLFNIYPRIIIFGTERDVIGLRSHHRKERVLLYPIKLNRRRAQGLFKAIIEDAIKVSDKPDFYNTLFDNCLTGIIQYEQKWSGIIQRLDYRLIFPGYSDELAYKFDLLDAQGSLEKLQSQAEIEIKQGVLLDDRFSSRIRRKWKTEFWRRKS